MTEHSTAYLALDLWMALGLPSNDFDGYYQRNGWADTWANLLDAVRRGFQGDDWCRAPMDGGTDFCVLHHNHTGPHYGSTDVGTSEPLPWPGDPP